MCLDAVDKKPTVTEGEGWKCFDLDESHHLEYQIMGGRVSGVGKWFADTNDGTIQMRGSTYPTGFHVFLSEEDAVTWCNFGPIRKVSFRQVVASGTTRPSSERPLPTIVAREIYIHPKGK